MIVFVGVSEISKMFGVSKQAVSNWTDRYKDFPKPLACLSMGSVWSKYSIERWGKKHNKGCEQGP